MLKINVNRLKNDRNKKKIWTNIVWIWPQIYVYIPDKPSIQESLYFKLIIEKDNKYENCGNLAMIGFSEHYHI